MPNNQREDQIRAELIRRELGKREAEDAGTPERAEAFGKHGVIKERPGFMERKRGQVVAGLPAIGQFVGGLAGSVGGAISPLKAPVRGQIAGGVGGRLVGKLLQRAALGEDAQFLDVEKKALGRELLETAGSEAVFGAVGAAGSKVGKGILGALLGERVAERGLKVGFKKLLDPKFFKDRFPKQVAKKTGQFFHKLLSSTGKSVKSSVEKKGKTIVSASDISKIRSGEMKILKDIGASNIDDLSSATVSKAEINKVKEAKRVFDRLFKKDPLTNKPLKEVNINEVWTTRKKIDDIRFNHRWNKDTELYLDKMRKLLNEPLKRDKDIARSFERYSFVREMERSLGKQFDATLLEGEVFTPKTEQFTSTLLSTSKDETVRILKRLDTFLGAEDKVIEDLLDVAAAEAIEKPIQFLGLLGRGVVGGAGGRKAIAQTAAGLQTPVVRTLSTLAGRGFPVGATELLQPSEGQ